MNIFPVRVEFFHTDGRMDMTLLTVASRKFAKSLPKKVPCAKPKKIKQTASLYRLQSFNTEK